MNSSRESLTQKFLDLLGRMSKEMHASSTEEWSDLELTMPQLRTLMLLSKGPQRMSDIAAGLGTSLSATTSLMDRLVNKELVERINNPDDRRVVLCQLSETGQTEVERIWRVRRSQALAALPLLNEDELQTVVNALEVLVVALERQQDPVSPAHAAGQTDVNNQ